MENHEMLGDERMIKEDTESMAILTAGNCTLTEKFKVELEVEKLLHAVEVARWARKGKGSQVCLLRRWDKIIEKSNGNENL
jgi:hypothetical protein